MSRKQTALINSIKLQIQLLLIKGAGKLTQKPNTQNRIKIPKCESQKTGRNSKSESKQKQNKDTQAKNYQMRW